jgi:probable F420-dependent oxidoreductase
LNSTTIERTPAKEYGILLPQFGGAASRERLIERCIDIERYGFDSVWVRDHIVYEPHTHEDPDRTHLDCFTVLSAVAAVTQKVKLCTGVLIPHRHPIHTALLFGSLDFLAGPGRVEAGIGVGTYGHEFAAIGAAGPDRRVVVEEQVKICRALWGGGSVDHHGTYYEFTDVEIKPVPVGNNIPIWYGGNSSAAVRRAVEYCDGWVPGRMPRAVFGQRMNRMRRLADEAGAPLPRSGTIPYVSPGETVEEGMKYLDIPNLISATNRMNESKTIPPLTEDSDLGGVAIAGPPETIIEEVRRDQEAGADVFVFDLRPRFDQYEEMLRLIGEEVLPALRAGDAQATS